MYRQECERLGSGPGMVVRSPSQTGTWMLSADPDRFWAHHGQHLLHEAREYAAWQVGLDPAASWECLNLLVGTLPRLRDAVA